MKLLKLSITASVLFFFGQNSFTQVESKHDIGITLTTYDNQRVGIDYRLRLNEHWKFRTGAYYGANYSNFFSTGKITSVTDSLITHRKYQSGSNSGTLKIGAERKFGESLFSVSADLIVGYRNSYSGYYNNYSELNSSGVWQSQTSIPAFDMNQPLGDSTRSQVTRHYIIPGLSIGANLNIPIKNRFILSLNASGLMTVPIFLKSTNIHDPYGELSNSNVTTFNFNSVISATLRYKFGLKG